MIASSLTLELATKASSRIAPPPTIANCSPAMAGTAAHIQRLEAEDVKRGQQSK